MSESLVGSKSKFYNQVVVPGATAESADNFQHVSVQEITGFRAALDTVIHGVFASGAAAAIEAGSIQKLIKVTAHGRIRGDIMKMTSGNSIDHEVAIIGIEDADYFYIATPMDIAVADTIQFYRHVTPSYTNTGALNVAVVPDPNAATSANQGLEIAALDSIANRTFVQTLFFNYASTSVSSAAWVQLIASTSDTIKHLTLFESGGYAMEIGIGAAASEVRLFVVPPGGFNGELPFPIPSGSRVSIRCLEVVTVSTGLIVANFLK